MNSNYFDWLPDEILLKMLLETDDLKTLSKWCQTSKRVNQICQDEGFWRDKYRKDYGESALEKGETWRERYKERIIVGINSPISGKHQHYGIIDQKGILYMTGENKFGQLGNGTTINSTIPIALQFKQKIIGISCSSLYTAALTSDGKIYLWGHLGNLKGIYEFIGDIELDKYGRMTVHTPRLFNFPHLAIKIHSGFHSLGIITTDLTPYFTGYMKPINIKALDIESLEDRYAIIGTDRKLYMWGSYYDLDLEDISMIWAFGFEPGLTIIDQPKHVPLPELVKQISFGSNHYAVLSTSGNVYIWGHNISGQLGLPVEELDTPTKLALPSPISFISMGFNTSAALTRGGKLYIWGANFNWDSFNKDLAPDWVNLKTTRDGTNYVPCPIQISIEGKMINYVDISFNHALSVTDDGMVNYWGRPVGVKGPYEM